MMANTALTLPRKLLDEYLSKAAEAMAAKGEDLGQRIKQAREERGLKQKDLAQAVHVEPMTVSRWERGVNTPDLDTLALIAQATGKQQSFFVEERKVTQTVDQRLATLAQNQQDAIALLRELVETVDELKEALREHDHGMRVQFEELQRPAAPRRRRA
jgi:transcriptional regulator with XRE-family HTH domain